MIRVALAAAAAALVLTACPPPSPAPISEGEGEEGEGEASCIPVTLEDVTFGFQTDVSTHYEARLATNLDSAAPDFLVLQFFNYNERIGDLGAGTFPLDDATNNNYGHCAECLLVFSDQATPNSAPARMFFQSGGTLRVEKNPREQLDLIGALEGLTLVESTIGGDALESAPVPGGDCLEVADVVLDLKFVPEGWTCDAADYNEGDGVCHCACGAVDRDCFPDDLGGQPPVSETLGCGGDQVCTFEGCRDTCVAFAGEGCEEGVCSFSSPLDVCDDAAAVDEAEVGEACSNDFNRQWCAVENTIPFGVCDFDLDGDGTRVCRPRCDEASDCAEGEECTSVVFPGTRGFCGPPFE